MSISMYELLRRLLQVAALVGGALVVERAGG